MTTVSFLPLLRGGTEKCIINISSEAGSIGSCWRDREYAYCMSKAALAMGIRILMSTMNSPATEEKPLYLDWEGKPLAW